MKLLQRPPVSLLQEEPLILQGLYSPLPRSSVTSILKEDKWHPVAYHSHSMSPKERNYLIADKEMLSVIRALEIWRHYLEGTKYEFEVWNDHQNLQWFITRQDLNRRQAHWAQYLSRFNLKWLHKAGVTMGKANAISRREDHMIGIEDDNKGVLVIPLEHVRQNKVLICDEGDKIHKKNQRSDFKVTGVRSVYNIQRLERRRWRHHER